MLGYVARRIAYMIPTIFLISVVAFAIIQLPPGDYLSTLLARYSSQGTSPDPAQVQALTERYGLNDPFYVQYWKWISNIVLHQDFGQSFEWSRPVSDLITDRLPLTVALTGMTLVTTWLIALPIGIYSAVRQYSVGDHLATTVGFLGLATPDFLLALVLMWVAFSAFGVSVGEANVVTMAIAVVVLGTAHTAGLIRILRANLLDELRKPAVVAARAQGLDERRLLVKYPLRVAMNPFFSTIGWMLPSLVGGEIIVATVLNLDTVGPLLLGALRSQDMYLAGSILLILGVLTVVGTLLSDLALAWLDPRVRLQNR